MFIQVMSKATNNAITRTYIPKKSKTTIQRIVNHDAMH